MYLPHHFAETNPQVLREAIAARPLGALVTLSPDGLTADHIPFLLEPRGELGVLIGHVARNNPVWRNGAGVDDALVIFQGPSSYISPNWYPSKHATHQAVPTYNYIVVHAHGPLLVHDDERWVRGVVGKLTKQFEASQPTPWRMGQAPPDYMRAMLANIVGIEIPLKRLTGKWKVNQNRTPEDRSGVVDALEASPTPEHVAMAALVRRTLERMHPEQ